MFSGLISRCSTPRAWAQARASRICTSTSRTKVHAGRMRTKDANDCPRRYSMTSNAEPSGLRTRSYTGTMPGWQSRATATTSV